MPSIAMKVYDYQWAATFGMETAAAAHELAGDGVGAVLIRNQTDPLPGSGVDQEGYLGSASPPAATDRAWADALRAAGLEVVQTTALFFAPAAFQVWPDARPIAATGEPQQAFDWYVGICPTHEEYLEAKTERMRRVVAELEPDGYFFSFTRYPGFWENWVAGYTFSDADRYCFCPRCLAQFAAVTDIDLPGGDVQKQARFILDRHGEAWMRWRCRRIRDVIGRIAAELRAIRPGLKIVLNTLPFPAADFDGLDARRTIAAQDLAILQDVVDRFELMTYLQILNRGDDWLAPVVADARRAASVGATLASPAPPQAAGTAQPPWIP